MCAKCIALEMEAVKAHQSVEKQEERLNEHKQSESIRLLEASKQIDQSIALDIDIFNAKTTALVEICNTIDADESVVNKPLAKAEYAHSRITHLQKVIFDLKHQIDEAYNEQRAAQVYLNKVANELRAEERERLKVEDISYQPTVRKQPKPKAAGTKTAVKTSAKQMVEQANLWAAKIGMPGTVIHMRMLQKNMNAEEATRTFAAELGLTVKE